MRRGVAWEWVPSPPSHPGSVEPAPQAAWGPRGISPFTLPRRGHWEGCCPKGAGSPGAIGWQPPAPPARCPYILATGLPPGPGQRASSPQGSRALSDVMSGLWGTERLWSEPHWAGHSTHTARRVTPWDYLGPVLPCVVQRETGIGLTVGTWGLSPLGDAGCDQAPEQKTGWLGGGQGERGGMGHWVFPL